MTVGIFAGAFEVAPEENPAAAESVRLPVERGVLLAHPYQEMTPMSAHSITLELPTPLYD